MHLDHQTIRAAPRAIARLNHHGCDPRVRLVLVRSPRFPATRRSRAGRAPGRSLPALALAGLLAGSGQTTQAKPAGAPPARVAESAPAQCPIAIVEGGHVTGQTTPANARRDGLTVV